jgi:hypothetical protein
LNETMPAGCFSWCPVLKQWDAKKQTTAPASGVEVSINSCCTISLTQNHRQEYPLAIVAQDPVEEESDQVSGLIDVVRPLTSICIQISSENTQAVVPSTTQYIVATGKQALALLQTAASVKPVPLLQDAIEIARKIIEVCEVRGILYTVT